MTEVIVQVKPLEKSGTLKAVADVTFLIEGVGELTIRRIKVVQQEGAKPWIGFPQESYQKDGKTQYVPIVQASFGARRLIEGKILDAYANAQRANA